MKSYNRPFTNPADSIEHSIEHIIEGKNAPWADGTFRGNKILREPARPEKTARGS